MAVHDTHSKRFKRLPGHLNRRMPLVGFHSLALRALRQPADLWADLIVLLLVAGAIGGAVTLGRQAAKPLSRAGRDRSVALVAAQIHAAQPGARVCGCQTFRLLEVPAAMIGPGEGTGDELPGDMVKQELGLHSVATADELFDKIVAWGRVAELLGFSAATERLYLMQADAQG